MIVDRFPAMGTQVVAHGDDDAALDEVNTRRVPVETLRSVDPALRTLTNLNRPEDYLQALADAGLEAPPEVLQRLQGDPD